MTQVSLNIRTKTTANYEEKNGVFQLEIYSTLCPTDPFPAAEVIYQDPLCHQKQP